MAIRRESRPRPSHAFATVRFAKKDGVAWVILNRPRQLNAYNMAMRDDLFAVLGAVRDDSEVRAMILAGAGAAFSTGGDLTEFGTAPSPIMARWVRFRRDVWGHLLSLPVATLAAIHGYTVGGGLEMALLCDVAIAADDTRICLPETGLGMIPGVAGTQTAPRRLGLGRALDLCITGRWIDARESLRMGLVAEVVPATRLKRRAQEMARALGRLPREQSRMIRLAVWDGLDLRLREGIEMERHLAKRYGQLQPEQSNADPVRARSVPARAPRRSLVL